MNRTALLAELASCTAILPDDKIAQLLRQAQVAAKVHGISPVEPLNFTRARNAFIIMKEEQQALVTDLVEMIAQNNPESSDCPEADFLFNALPEKARQENLRNAKIHLGLDPDKPTVINNAHLSE